MTLIRLFPNAMEIRRHSFDQEGVIKMSSYDKLAFYLIKFTTQSDTQYNKISVAPNNPHHPYQWSKCLCHKETNKLIRRGLASLGCTFSFEYSLISRSVAFAMLTSIPG